MIKNKKKLLIAGGGYADIPLIEAAKSLGFYVITSGNREEDLGHSYADEYRPADFSDEHAMLALAKELKIDAICPCCNDFSAISSAFVAESMNLPGQDSFEITKIIHHKDLYRKFTKANNIKCPKAEGFDTLDMATSALTAFKYPIIIKPVDLTGGKGVTRADTKKDAIIAINVAFNQSKAKRIVIEEFIEGSHHGISTFIRDGKVVFYFFDDEYYYKNPYLVSAASTPGDVSPSNLADLQEQVELITNKLDLKTGIVHVQFIVDKSKQAVIIEICRRSPGDLYTRLVQLATGVNYPEYIVKASAGMDCSQIEHMDSRGYFTRHCIMASQPGRINDVIYDPFIKDNIIDEFLWWKPGDLITDHLTQKLGIVFLQFNSYEEMKQQTMQMQELIKVDLS